MTRITMHATHMLRVAAVSATLVLSALPSINAQTTRTPPPPLGKPKPFSLPARQEMTLPNGMKVTFIPFGRIPKVTVINSIRTGNIDEGPGQTWLADVTGDLMREGTTTRTALQLAEAGAAMGGSVTVAIGGDNATIGGTVLAEGGPEMVRLVADVTRNPRFPASEMPRIIAGRVRNLSIAMSQPGPTANEKFVSSIYGDHPYGHPYPTEAELKSYTVDQARDFYTRNFGAARAHLYVVGMFDRKAMEAAVRESFADWKAGNPPSVKPASPKSTAILSLIDRPNAPQSTIIMGLPVIPRTSPDAPAFEVANALLGGTFGSRITSNIREQKGYTYSPGSFVSNHPGTAYWAEQADVTTKFTGASIKEILNEVNRLRSEAPPTAELEGVKNNMIGIFTLQNASRAGIAGQLIDAETLGLPTDFLSTYVSRISAVTPADVQRVTKEQITPDRFTIVVVGDKKTVEEQVAPYQKPVP